MQGYKDTNGVKLIGKGYDINFSHKASLPSFIKFT